MRPDAGEGSANEEGGSELLAVFYLGAEYPAEAPEASSRTSPALIGPGSSRTVSDTANSLQVLERNGGHDGTRTRGLCRDSPASNGFTTT